MTGLIGTVENHIGDMVEPVTRTTPESLDLQRLLRRMADSGVEVVAMEVSSHALELHRVSGCKFDVVVFTNLTQDHLDFHISLEEYFGAKKRLFEVGGVRPVAQRRRQHRRPVRPPPFRRNRPGAARASG